MFRRIGFGVAAGTCLCVSAVNVYYVPSAEPYLWTDTCWFTDEAGTTASEAGPTTEVVPYFSAAALQNGTVTIPTGTEAQGYALELRAAGLTLAIEDGASLTTRHTTTFGKADGTTLRVKSGGTFTCNSICNIADGTRKNVKLVVEPDGSANFPSHVVNVGNNTSGSAFVENQGDIYFYTRVNVGALSSWKVGGAKSSMKGYFDNSGTLRTRSSGSAVFVVGAHPGVTGHFTNRVEGTATFMMAVSVGGGTNGTGYAVNNGTMTVGDSTATRVLFVGGDSLSSVQEGTPEGYGATGTFRNNASLTATGVTLGGHKYGTGTFDNYGDLKLNGNLVVAERSGTTGRFTARGGSTTTLSGSCKVSYYGDATLSAEGDAQITGGGKGLFIANDKGSSVGRVMLSGTSCFRNVGTVEMGIAGTTQADLVLSDSAVLDGTGSFFVGRGTTSSSISDVQHARVALSGHAMITNLNGNVYLATNNYGRAELEVADDAVIDFKDVDASRTLWVGSHHSGTRATLRLRGGTIRLPSTNSTIRVGFNSYTAAYCNGFLTGWGRIVRHRYEETPSYVHAINLVMPCGAIVADGEGVARDLDLSMVRKINDGNNVGANLSGTNGWYAVNKGRLYYPSRYTGYRNLGTYYGDSGAPAFVNGVHFVFTGRASDGQLHGQLYATDRADIPEGLPEDDAEKGVMRLGVWRAGLRSDYRAELAFEEGSTAKAFTSAAATIRYDNHRLGTLKDAEGAFRENQRVCLYQFRNGSWAKVTSLPVAAGEEAGSRISGTLLPTSDEWNMGFFAVVAEIPRGTALIVR